MQIAYSVRTSRMCIRWALQPSTAKHGQGMICEMRWMREKKERGSVILSGAFARRRGPGILERSTGDRVVHPDGPTLLQ